ncbi:MAG: FHA domain-containing protein, partial [Planctomycetota bacterium]|nr:FHA domain-containing protein [Planctomycetota bacterium]
MQVPFEIILERDQLQQVIQVNSDVAIIGRGQDCDVCVNDPLASRHHCRIELVDNQVYLVDLDSRNGSWVGGNRIDRHMFVGSDILRIGSTTIKLHNGFEQRLDAIESTQIQQMSRHQQALRTMLSSVNSAQLEERIPQLAAIVVDAAVNLCRAERGFLFLLKGERIDYSIARNFANE